MIQILPSDNKHRTQNDAISYYNSIKERMMSMVDVWQIAKDNDTKTINELRKEFRGLNWCVTSTQLIYDKNNLSGKVVHNADSKVVKPTRLKVKEIPVCQPAYINELLSTQAGLAFIRALINHSKATKEEIIRNLELLSGKQAKNIKVWTPTLSQRKYRPIRALRLCFDGFGTFDVDGSGWFSGGGLSRRVRIINQKPKVSKHNPIANRQSSMRPNVSGKNYRIENNILIINIDRKVITKINKIEIKIDS